MLKRCKQRRAGLPLPPSWVVCPSVGWAGLLGNHEWGEGKQSGEQRLRPILGSPSFSLVWLIHGEGCAPKHVGLVNLMKPELSRRRKTWFPLHVTVCFGSYKYLNKASDILAARISGDIKVRSALSQLSRLLLSDLPETWRFPHNSSCVDSSVLTPGWRWRPRKRKQRLY